MHSHTSLSSKYELKNPKYKFEDFGEHFCTSMSKFNLPCLLSVSLWQKKCFLEIFQIDFSLSIYKNTCTCTYVLKKKTCSKLPIDWRRGGISKQVQTTNWVSNQQLTMRSIFQYIFIFFPIRFATYMGISV